jgi:hypothetical protein
MVTALAARTEAMNRQTREGRCSRPDNLDALLGSARAGRR